MTVSQTDMKQMMDALIDPVRVAGEAIMTIHASGVAARDKPDGSPPNLSSSLRYV